MTRVEPVGESLFERARAAVERITAPDVVIAVSERGRRDVLAVGTAPRSTDERARQRYEIGSASKTFAALLLADLVEHAVVGFDDRAAAHLHLHLPTRPSPRADAVTLYRLATHTSGLPCLPRDFYRQALPRWNTNPYADYSPRRLLDAFARSRPRGRRRWHYSNFGASVLGHALAHATATPYDALLTERVLHPLALRDTALHPTLTADAVGHRGDGHAPVPALDMGAFTAAGAIRATPGDLLTYLEAHLEPEGPLAEALHRTRTPTAGPGFGHPHTHTLTWFRHPTDHGPAYFHPGATPGQQAFLGFRPATRTAVAVLATRRYTRRDPFGAVAHDLLTS